VVFHWGGDVWVSGCVCRIFPSCSASAFKSPSTARIIHPVPPSVQSDSPVALRCHERNLILSPCYYSTRDPRRPPVSPGPAQLRNLPLCDAGELDSLLSNLPRWKPPLDHHDGATMFVDGRNSHCAREVGIVGVFDPVSRSRLGFRVGGF
jgi:hypothetical protein